MIISLKKCKYCGKNAEIVIIGGLNGYRVQCEDYYCDNKTEPVTSESLSMGALAKAIDIWNKQN